MSPSFSGSPGAARESMVCCDAAAVIRGGYSVLLRRDKHLPRLPQASRTVTPQRNHVHLGHPAPPRTPLAGDPGRQPRRDGRPPLGGAGAPLARRSEEHTSELQSLMRTSYAVFCLKKKTPTPPTIT